MAYFVKVKSVHMNGYSLLNIRLWFYCLALFNLLFTACMTISIDMTVDEDPKVRTYNRLRWFLLTSWYNIVSLFYVPLCIYIDWREKCRNETPQVHKFRLIRDIIMNSILFPVTTFGDAAFWILIHRAPWIIAPLGIFKYVPNWAQHSFHTVSFVFVISDLVLTPRSRPKSHRINLIALVSFSCLYFIAISVSCSRGEYVYLYLETASRLLCISVFLVAFLITITLYYIQWYFIDYVWAKKDYKIVKKLVKLN